MTADPRMAGIDAADLLALDLPPLRWVVPDLLPKGTTILASPPKVGKSSLVYQVAVEATLGGDLFGRRVTRGACCTSPSVGTALIIDTTDVDIYTGLEYRIDVSSEAGTRFDQNITGFRAEEEFGFNANRMCVADACRK